MIDTVEVTGVTTMSLNKDSSLDIVAVVVTVADNVLLKKNP
jgi:hypothetical protein